MKTTTRLQFATAALFLFLAGCSIWPSTWRIGRSPVDQHAKDSADQKVANSEFVGGLQSDVHKALTALTGAPKSRQVDVARDFMAEAAALLDQAHGAPSADQVAKWDALVQALLSDNAAVRASAEKERASESALTSDLAQRLARATAKAERSEAKALEYAKSRDGLADFAGKLKLGFWAVIVLIVLGTVLSLVARFVPALSLASKVVNTVIAPGITFVAHRAEAGLKAIGQGMMKLRAKAGPEAEALIEHSFDTLIDRDQKAIISAAAKTAPTT